VVLLGPGAVGQLPEDLAPLVSLLSRSESTAIAAEGGTRCTRCGAHVAPFFGQYDVTIYDRQDRPIFRGTLTIAGASGAFELTWAVQSLPSGSPARYKGTGLLADCRQLAASWQADAAAARQADQVIPGTLFGTPRRQRESLRELMAAPEAARGIGWLRQALQFAIRLEFFTIPPYLTAMWTIKELRHPVRALIAEIAQMEMIHMGLACNLLTTIQGTPVFATAEAAPRYPGPLPGDVHPGLVLRLHPLNKCLIEHVFMEIEQSEFEPLARFAGEEYPTIGAFYTAVGKAFEKLDPKAITGERQLEYEASDVIRLTKVDTSAKALDAVTLIKEQGEGTTSSPFFGQDSSMLAHYYRFGEIFCERHLARDCMGNWSYTGRPLPFPHPDQIYPMATIPPGGYEEAKDFDIAYTRLLRKLQSAWECGGKEGQDLLDHAVQDMTNLFPLAKPLLEKPIPGTGGWTYYPGMKDLHTIEAAAYRTLGCWK
jgi:hypothetical protein